MRILLDHNVPAPLIRFLPGHQIVRARELHWDRLPDTDSLAQAEQAGFELLLSGDQRLCFQAEPRASEIVLVVLTNTNWSILRRYVRRIAAAVSASTPGTCTEVEIPFR